MRHAPTEQELTDITSMTALQRVQYFLTRTLESEEIWGLADTQGWVLRELMDKALLPVWPYRQYAGTCIDAPDLRTHATSLDHFVEGVLQALVEQNIHIEVWPAQAQGGVIVKAAELLAMYKSLMESGEYFLEG